MRLASIHPPPHSRRDWLAAAALAVIAFAVFAPSLRCEFVSFDDLDYVTGNPHVQQGVSFGGTLWALTTFQVANWHPLTWLSLQLDATLWKTPEGKLDPWGFHLTNVLLHAANAALVYLALRALTGAYWRSAAAALLFAVHPLRVESVAWVAERKDVLSIFFGLLALLAYARYARAPSARRYLAVAVALALSLMAKPMMVTLPFLLLVLDWWPLGRIGVRQIETAGTKSAQPGAIAAAPQAITVEKGPDSTPASRGQVQTWLRLVVEKLPLLALVVASSFVTYQAQAKGGATRDLEAFPLSMRAENAVVSYVAYLAKTFWPVDLAPFYPHAGVELAAWQGLGGALVLLGVTAGAVALRRRTPYLLTGWLWFVGTLVPVIGLVQVGNQAYADRYTYFPQVGLLIALCWSFADLAVNRPALVLTASVLAAFGLIVRCEQQIETWHDSYTLWHHALKVTRPNPTALISFGTVQEEIGQPEAAARSYREALALESDSVLARLNLGALLSRQGDQTEATRQLQEAFRLAPNYALVHTYLGNVLFQQGKWDEAARQQEEAIRLLPELSESHCNLGQIEQVRGHPDRAAEHYREALRLRPDFAEAHYGLAAVLIGLGHPDESVAHLREALRSNPRLADAHLVLGQQLDRQGDRNGAAEHYQEAARLDPKQPNAWYGLGMVRARQGRAADAEECLTKALKYDPDSKIYKTALAIVLHALAAAQAGDGHGMDAIATEERARDLAAAAERPELVSKIDEALRHYRRGEVPRPAPVAP